MNIISYICNVFFGSFILGMLLYTVPILGNISFIMLFGDKSHPIVSFFVGTFFVITSLVIWLAQIYVGIKCFVVKNK